MKMYILLVILSLSVIACAHVPKVAEGNRTCPGLTEDTKLAMHLTATMVHDEEMASKLREEAAVCEDLYMAFVKGIIKNRFISKSYAQNSFEASCGNGPICDSIFERYWIDASFDK